ncbi:MAG: citrate synthase [Phycisphaeraceae bacterium]
MSETAKVQLGDKSIELPIVVGSENERAVDISQLRADTGHITLDDGYSNTGSCQSAITFINGEKGELRYRGIPIEQLAERSTFIEAALLLIYGELPTREHTEQFQALLTEQAGINEGMRHSFAGFPNTGHPMAVLSAMINTLSCYHPDLLAMDDAATFEGAAGRLLSKVRTIAAASYKTSRGEPMVYPRKDLNYVQNFLHMMFSLPYDHYEPDDDVVNALELFFILHADHEQNCSTSTVRMVASSGANLFASCAAGVCALWGWKHGGANVAVIDMLEQIHSEQIPLESFLKQVRDRERKLMGFGHRVYKTYDPRANVLKEATDKVLSKMHKKDPLLDIARKLEEVALKDSYFRERNLYPNVDFYSGIMLRAIGIPVDMFTVLFAIGRMPGWIANYKEVHDADARIYRPRQVYVGPATRDYVAVEKRG